MPGSWDAGTMVTVLPPQIEQNFEDKNKKLGEGNNENTFHLRKTAIKTVFYMCVDECKCILNSL